MEKLKLKAVIFDLGSTLIEYESSSWPELFLSGIVNVQKSLKKKGFDIPDESSFVNEFDKIVENYRQIANDTNVEWSITEGISILLERFNIPDENNYSEKLFDAFYKPIEKGIYSFDDTLSTVKKLKEEVGIVGLVSNTIFPEQAHLADMEKFNILDYFDFTIFSSTYGLRKPHADIFYQAVNQAGVAPAETVYVGDRYLEDVVGPKSIGMNAILKVIQDREYPLDMPKCDRTVYTLTELLEHIDLE